VRTFSITLGGTFVPLPCIDPAVDAAFASLYEQVDNGAVPDAMAFDAGVVPFLQHSRDSAVHDAYFNLFTPLWLHFLRQGRATEAIAVWPWALRPALVAETESGQALHKGTPYYFWGMTLLVQESLEEGYLLMHRALEEDVRTHRTSAPDTPGWALATLDHERLSQAFLPWVKKQAAHVEARLNDYRSTHQRLLTLPELRSRFLAIPTYRDAAQQFCFSMARALRLRSLPLEVWDGPFPAQIAFGVVFDLCLVVDSVLREKNSTKWQFIDHASFLSNAAKLGLSRDDLREINGQFCTSFPLALHATLAETLKLNSGATVKGLDASLALTYGCRNRGAHSVASAVISPAEFDQIVQRVCETLFLAVEQLFP
jgi:hypothetical protein